MMRDNMFKGYQEDIDELLSIIFRYLCNALSGRTDYALKGGYIVSHFISPNMRNTTDVDLSIESINTFDYIVNSLSPLLNELVTNGYIYTYTVSKPIVTEQKKRSGSIRLYAKRDENTRKYQLCKIDMGIHSLSFGIRLLNGLNVFSIERMLSDKISVLYSDFNTIYRRCKDLYDIYLFNYPRLNPDITDLMLCLNNTGVDILLKSTFKTLPKDRQYMLSNHLKNFLVSGKETTDVARTMNIPYEEVVKVVLETLWYIRNSLQN